MGLKLWWTAKARGHIGRHGVSAEEVELALRGRTYRRKARAKVILIGHAGSRCLFIVLRPARRHPSLFEVATARLATRAEKRLFARRGKGS